MTAAISYNGRTVKLSGDDYIELDRGIKGDALKENARVALENAMIIVNKGTYQWKKK